MADQTPVIAMTNEQLTQLIASIQLSRDSPVPASGVHREESKTGNFVKCNARFDGKPDSDVEAFIDAVEIYKDCANVSDENALRGLPMLLHGIAATWWQGLKVSTTSWSDAIQSLRDAYGPQIPPYQIYRELFNMEHCLDTPTDIFVCRARALLAKIPDALSEKVQVDMIYGLLHRKIRKRVLRDNVTSFKDILKAARIVEQSLKESEGTQKSKEGFKKEENKPNVLQNKDRPKCKFCKKFGHRVEECRNKKKVMSEQASSTPEPKETPVTKDEKKETTIKCYGCGAPGFIRSQCPTCTPTVHADIVEFYNLTAHEDSLQPRRPVLPIKILGASGVAYADSGAQASIAGHTLYQVLKRKGCKFKEDTVRIAYADGLERNEKVLKTTVDVSIKEHEIPTTFIIFPELNSNSTLLGINFMEKANIILNSGERTWSFGEDPNTKYQYAEEPDRNKVAVNVVSVAEVQLREDEGTKLSEEQRTELNSVLLANATIFTTGGEATSYAEHRINTGDHEPIYVPPYKVSAHNKELLKKELDRMLEEHIIEECESPWGAPTVLVPKKDGGVRVCVDYRKMNAITVSDSYPMPRIDELLQNAKRTPYMTTIDLRAGYHQVKIRDQDRDKTCFVTPFGTYRFLRMPFGLRNAPATFQRLIDKFKTGLGDISIFAYLDDIIILSETFKEHIQDLKRVFNRLKLFNLRAKREKCNFACNVVRYLGHLITADGIQVDPNKIQAIVKIPQPRSVKHVQSFLQTCSWYRKFIPNFSEVAKPLCELTRKNKQWKWGKEENDSFEKLKELLTTVPVLQQADTTKPYVLRTDASNFALGAVLLQGEGNMERPIEYASRLLLPAERNYTTTEREALAVVWAIDKFRGYLEGAKVRIGTDHQPLKWLLALKTPTGRLARWALRLQSYDMQIEYTPGKRNVVADMLSRPPCTEATKELCDLCTVSVDLRSANASEIREEQRKDPEVRKIIDAFEGNDSVDISRWTDRGYILTNGVLYRYCEQSEGDEPQLVVSAEERKRVMEKYHDDPTAGHYGVDRTIKRIATRYYFPGMRKYVEEYLKKCPECQRYKATTLKPAGLLQTPAPTQRFETIAIDLVGPLPETEEGYRWIFIIEDTASKWIEIFPLQRATASACAQVLINEIFLRYGTPRRIISDNGVQFISDVMQQLTYWLEIRQSLIPLYHPESNPVERKNRDLKTQLAILVEGKHRKWAEQLPAIRFAMNTVKSASTGYSAAYLTFGRELRTPDDVQHDLRHIAETDVFIPTITPYLRQLTTTLGEARENIEKQQDLQKTKVDQRRRPVETFVPGDKVLVKSHVLSNANKGLSAKLAPKRDGPYLIKRVVTPTTYELEEASGLRRSIGKYHTTDLTKFQDRQNESAQPMMPKRGRGRPRKDNKPILSPGPRTRSSAANQRGRV